MRRSIVLGAVAGAAFITTTAIRGAEVTYRLDVEQPVVFTSPGGPGVTTATVPLAAATGSVEVVANVTIASAIDQCRANPAACDGGEYSLPPPAGSGTGYGCGDGIDNDGDRLMDLEDPDCIGVQGWSVAVATDACFGIGRATTRGTVADLDVRPPGLRDSQGSFEKTEIADPQATGGLQGAVSSAVLSLLNPVILPPAGEAVVLKLTGLMDASGLVPGVASAPCSLRFRDLGIRGGAAAADGGGASIGEGVTNVVTVRRESLIPDTRGLDVLLLLDVPPQVTLRVDVAGPLAAAGPRRRLDADRSIVPWEVASTTGEATLPVEAGVTLESRLEPCVSDPPACVGENFQEVRQDGTVIYGCLDGVDNDGDGRTDLTDLSCVAAQGWSLVLAVEPCFGLVSATTRGTVADTRPPGWRDPSGSFEKTDVVPIRGAAGVVAVVSAVVLSFQKPIFLPQVSDSTVLLLTGEMAVPAAPGESGDACRLEFLHYLGESLAAIAGDGQGADEPIPTLVAVGGSSVSPHLTDAELRVANRAAEFLRGDTNGDSKADMSDPITILGHLFLGGRIRNCRDAADVDDSGFINIADAVFELSFLFLSGAVPPPPGSRSCGPDPTADPLGCDENETACAP